MNHRFKKRELTNKCKVKRSRSTSVRPVTRKLDSYDWEDPPPVDAAVQPHEQIRQAEVQSRASGPTAKVPVGVSRLHEVVIPDLQ